VLILTKNQKAVKLRKKIVTKQKNKLSNSYMKNIMILIAKGNSQFSINML